MFVLHEQLAVDTIAITKLPLCQIRLMDDSTYPWLILVPKVQDIRELFELSEDDQGQLMKEITIASRALYDLFKPEKLNIGALGNVVPQFHLHIVGRNKEDPTWPRPVWGGTPKPYDIGQSQRIVEQIKDILS